MQSRQPSFEQQGYRLAGPFIEPAAARELNRELEPVFEAAGRVAWLRSLPHVEGARRRALRLLRQRDAALLPVVGRIGARGSADALIAWERARAPWVSALVRDHSAHRVVMQYGRSRRLRSLAAALVDEVRAVLDDDPVLFFSSNLRRGGQIGAHIDSFEGDPCGQRFVAAWVALQDIDTDQGPLYVMPGSHRLSETERQLVIDGGSPPVGAVPLPLRSGHAVLWHHHLVHGSMPVRDPKAPRHSVVFHFAARGLLPRSSRLKELGSAYYRDDVMAVELPVLAAALRHVDAAIDNCIG